MPTRARYRDAAGRGFAGLLHAAFHRRDTRIGKLVDGVVWALILASLALFGTELALDPDAPLQEWLIAADHVVLWCFAVEIVLRVASYRPPALDLFSGGAAWRARVAVTGRLRYLFTPMMLVDLMAVLALVPALRGLRALRLLRLLRGVRLFRYSNPVLGVLRTFQENALLYSATLGFLMSIVLLGGTSFYLVEGPVNPGVNSIADGIWWALVTLTTVGFGDIAPHTVLGRVVGGTVMVLGMFTLALFAGVVGSTLLRVLVRLREDQFRMSNYANHIVVCGYDPASLLLLDALRDEVGGSGTELVVFAAGERPPDLPPEFIWVRGDPSRESELDKVRLAHAKVAIVVGSRGQPPAQADATTILVAFTIRAYLRKKTVRKERRTPLYLVTEILDPENVAHARTAGADEVVATTRLGFSLLAHAAVVPGAGNIMSEVASAGAHSLYIEPYPFEEGMTYGELSARLHDEHGVVVFGLRDAASGNVRLNPADDAPVPPDAEVVYLGRAPVLFGARS